MVGSGERLRSKMGSPAIAEVGLESRQEEREVCIGVPGEDGGGVRRLTEAGLLDKG